MKNEYWLNLYLDVAKDDRAAEQKALDRQWENHLKAKGRRRQPMVVKKLRGGRS